MVWPLVVWWLAGHPRRLMAVSLAVCLASFAARVIASLAGVGPVATYVFTPLELDALALGSFFAIYLRQQGTERAARRAVVVLVVVGIALQVVQYAGRHLAPAGAAQEFANAALSVRLGGFRALLAALLLQVVYAAPDSLWSRVFRGGPLVFLGKYSYGLYVYHHFLSYYLSTHDTIASLANVVGSRLVALMLQATAGMAVSMLVAWLSYEYFEKKFLGLKRYWSASRDAGPSGRGGRAHEPVR